MLNTLMECITQSRVSHAYLVVGPPQVGKTTLATDFTKMLNCLGEEGEIPCGTCKQCNRIDRCLHTDVRVVERGASKNGVSERRSLIGIDQIREIQRDSSLTPFEGRYRVFIIKEAEYLSEEAANSLLKILEEPPGKIVLILLTSDIGAMLPTVTSRCQKLELRSIRTKVISDVLCLRYDMAENESDEIARLSEGRPGWAFQVAANPEILVTFNNKIEFFEKLLWSGIEIRLEYVTKLVGKSGSSASPDLQVELKDWLRWWRDILFVKMDVEKFITHFSHRVAIRKISENCPVSDITRVLRNIEATRDHLNRNVNSRLALENMMLSMPFFGTAYEANVMY